MQRKFQELKSKIPFYQERYLIKPGLSGWAQIKYGYTSSIEDNFEKTISPKWQEISGIWIWKDRMYIGYSGARSFISTKYLSAAAFSGKFLLSL